MKIQYNIADDEFVSEHGSLYPAVTAIGDNGRIGGIWTTINEDFIIAHLTPIDHKTPWTILIHLTAIYEALLLSAGIDKYSFSIEKSNNGFRRFVEAMPEKFEKIEDNPGDEPDWYMSRIPNALH